MSLVRWVALCAMALGAAQNAEAVRVTSVTAGAGLGTVFTLNAVAVNNNAVNNEALLGGAGVAGTNSIDLDITVLRKQVPFSLSMAIEEDGSDSGGTLPTGFADLNATRYTVNLTLRNGIVEGHDYMNGFDVNASGSNLPLLSALDDPYTSHFYVDPNAEIGGGTVRFGGLNGGGFGSLSFGEFGVSTFDYIVTATGGGSDTHSLNFTANPEPGTLILGGLSLIPAGVFARRRRNSKTSAA